MKLAVLNAKKTKTGDASLPKQFDEAVRPDLIQRAVLALQANRRQPYGADPDAGKRASAELSRRRRKYRGSYGKGISRVPRKILTRRGSQMYMVGAFAPGTVGGRRAHAPKAEKQWTQKVNAKENRKAIRSALAAVMDKELVAIRGHKLPPHYPFVADGLEALKTTKEVAAALEALGFADELARARPTKVRAGKATMRGRKTKRATSLLLLTGDDCPLLRAAQNVPGVDAVPVRAANAELLAPGTHPGRATIMTKEALAVLEHERLFLERQRVAKEKPAKAAKKTAKAAKPAPQKSESKKTEKKADKKTDAKKPAATKPAPKGEAA